MNAHPKFIAGTAHVDAAAVQPLPRSRKVHVEGSRPDIQVPDVETRVAILERKARDEGVDLPMNVAKFIAARFESNRKTPSLGVPSPAPSTEPRMLPCPHTRRYWAASCPKLLVIRKTAACPGLSTIEES